MINAQLNLDVAQVKLQTLRRDARNARLVRTLPSPRLPHWLVLLLSSLRSSIPTVRVPAASSPRD